MANPEHLRILDKGVQAWNEWRMSEPYGYPDLSNAGLQGMDLRGVLFGWANLCGADLRRANLSPADQRPPGMPFSAYYIRTANTADNLRAISTSGCADLRYTELQRAHLTDASLDHSVLVGADISGAALDGTSFYGASFGSTVLGGVDLTCASISGAKFTEPCTIDLATLRVLKLLSLDVGRQAELVRFLRGCGLSDWEIEAAKLHSPDLTGKQITDITYRIHDLLTTQPVQINPLFISYSHDDGPFVDALEVHLNDKGIRFWRDIHHATAGPLERQIDRAIRLYPTVLLVLSDRSVESDWVEHEARAARKLAKELGRDVLCPIALDDSWKTCSWPARLKEQIMEYHILDFSAWEADESLKGLFAKLLDGLNLFYRDVEEK